MPHQGATLCFGASGGFTLASFYSALTAPSSTTWAPFVASLISTLVGLYIAERNRATHERAERAHHDHEAQRDRQLLKALASIAPVCVPTIRASELGKPHCEGS